MSYVLHRPKSDVLSGQHVDKTMQQKLHRWFIPRTEEMEISPQTSKGLFIPWPLLAIIFTVGFILIGGVVTLQVQMSRLDLQISNLTQTMLTRDADIRAEIQGLNDKAQTLQVYIQNDREKIIKLETEQENSPNGKRRSAN